MGNILKGIMYTALAGATGFAGYMIGKYKHMKGVSLTMVGLALVLYAPKGCEVAETYLKTRAQTEQARIYGTFRKDSLDKMIRNDELEDSTSYLKQMLDDARSARKNIENTYKGMIQSSQSNLQKIIEKNDAAYTRALNELKEKNLQLEKGILMLEDQKAEAEIKLTRTNDSIRNSVMNTIERNPSGYYSLPYEQSSSAWYENQPKLLGQRTLDDGTVERTYRDKDGRISKQYVIPAPGAKYIKDVKKR